MAGFLGVANITKNPEEETTILIRRPSKSLMPSYKRAFFQKTKIECLSMAYFLGNELLVGQLNVSLRAICLREQQHGFSKIFTF